MLKALENAAPAGTRSFCAGPARSGAALVLYGLGGQDRYGFGLQHAANGAPLIAWDVGYWSRKGDDSTRKLRVTINGLHPPQYIMRGPRPSSSRWLASGLSVQQRGDPAGPIILVGNGPKSNAIGARGWAATKSLEIRDAFPGRRVIYRPKPERPNEPGVICDAVSTVQPIDALLSGASLVVCRHSNVAVDACRLGVPVVCEDGAAAAIYPSNLSDAQSQPPPELRIEFLHRLAWWQWSPIESAEFWKWIQGVLREI